MMDTTASPLAKFLTYCGTLPLLGGALFAAQGGNQPDIALVAITYAAVIISFICGIHWGIYLFAAQKCPRNLFITSNATALLAWLSLLCQDHSLSLILQSYCFLYLLILDYKLRACGVTEQWFYQLRRNASAIVVLALLAIALLLHYAPH